MLTSVPEAIPNSASECAEAIRERCAGDFPGCLVDRSLMRTVTFVVEKRILPRDVDLEMLREASTTCWIRLFDKPQKFFHFVQKMESAGVPVCELQTKARRRIKGGKIYRCTQE